MNAALKDYPELLDVYDLREILRIGMNNAYRLIRENEICSFRIGNKIRIPKKEVIKYIRDKDSS